jgi:hypothetical protein
MKRPIKHNDKYRNKDVYSSWNIKHQNKKKESHKDTSSKKVGMNTERQGRKANWKCNHQSFHLIKDMSSKKGSFAEELFKICERHKLNSEIIWNDPRQATKEGEVEECEAKPVSSPDLDVTVLEGIDVSEEPIDGAGRITCVPLSKLVYQPSECKDKPLNNATGDEKQRKRSEGERGRSDKAADEEECRMGSEGEKGKDKNTVSEEGYRKGREGEKKRDENTMTGEEYRKRNEAEKRTSDHTEEKAEELSVPQQVHKEGKEEEKGDKATSEGGKRKGNESEIGKGDNTVSEKEYRKGSGGEKGRSDNAMSEEEYRKGNQAEKRKCVHREEEAEEKRESASQQMHKKVKIQTGPMTEAQDTPRAQQIAFEEGRSVVEMKNIQSDFRSMVAIKTEKIPSALENGLSVVKTEPGLFNENNLESTELAMYKEQLKLEDLSIVVETETLEEETYPASMDDLRNYLNTFGMPVMKKGILELIL